MANCKKCSRLILHPHKEYCIDCFEKLYYEQMKEIYKLKKLIEKLEEELIDAWEKFSAEFIGIEEAHNLRDTKFQDEIKKIKDDILLKNDIKESEIQ